MKNSDKLEDEVIFLPKVRKAIDHEACDMPQLPMPASKSNIHEEFIFGQNFFTSALFLVTAKKVSRKKSAMVALPFAAKSEPEHTTRTVEEPVR
jgi:hypothetical protein